MILRIEHICCRARFEHIRCRARLDAGKTHYKRFHIEKWREGMKRLSKTLVLCCRVSGKRI